MFKPASLTIATFFFAVAASNAASWKIDRVHSSVGFTVRHMMVSKVSGSFTDFSGTIEAEPTVDGSLDLASAKVTMVVKSTSIHTANDNRDEHLRSADFFDAANFPEWSFVSKKVVPQDGSKFQLIGDLTLRGVTKEVTFDAEFNGVITDPRGTEKAGFSATSSVNRQDFQISWSKALDNGGVVVSDKVDIVVELEVVKEVPEAQG